MKSLWTVAAITAVCLTWAAGPARAGETLSEPDQQVKKMIRDITLVPPAVADDRHFWCGLAARTEWSTAGIGGLLEAGYVMRFFGVDARFSLGSTDYERISAAPGYSQLGFATPSAVAPEAELNRPRDGKDAWTYTLIEPGLSINSRMFSRMLPLLAERARVGFAYGGFQDLTHGVDFTAYLFSAEAAMLLQLGTGSRWSLSGSLNWHTGILISKTDPDQSLSLRRLPLSWLTGSLGLTYAF